jgi:hypothetical protein
MDEAGAAAGGFSRAEVKQALIQRCLQDESFRQRVLADPKATIEQELREQLPANLEVRVLEEAPEVVYLVLPPSRSVGELSDKELDAVAGGVKKDPDGGSSGPKDPIGDWRRREEASGRFWS